MPRHLCCPLSLSPLFFPLHTPLSLFSFSLFRSPYAVKEPDDFHDAGAQLLDKEREMHRVLDLCRHHRDELEAANRETPREELDQLFDVMDAIAVSTHVAAGTSVDVVWNPQSAGV